MLATGAPLTRDVESHSERGAHGHFLSTISRYENISSQNVKLWAMLGALNPISLVTNGIE